MNKILIVDDEKNILRALKRVFFKTDYHIFYAESGEQALDILKSNTVDVVVSDVRMPIMDGVELLKRVKALYPEAIRIFLSGYTEADQILYAMQENLAQAFVYKPWNNAELLNLIDCVITIRDELQVAKMYKCVQCLDQIPTISNYYYRIEQALQDDEDIDVIASYLEEDPALVMRLLKLANSAYYGRSIASIEKAIILVGGDMLKKLILTQQIFKNCDDNDLIKILWEHILKVIHILGNMKNILKIKDEQTLVTMGVLHTMGMIFFASRNKSLVLNAINEDSTIPIDQRLEKEVGLSHTMAGSYLLHWWQMPLSIYECARHYMQPSKASKANGYSITLIHIASYYAWKSLNFESLNHKLDMDAIEYYDIDIERIENSIDELAQIKEG